MAFVPGRIADVGDDRVELARGRESVVDAHGIEDVAGGPQLGQQADRSLEDTSGPFADELAHGALEGHAGIAEMVAAPEADEPAPLDAPEPAAREDAVELGQVEVQHAEPLREAVPRLELSRVADAAFVDRALHHALASIARTTAHGTLEAVLVESPAPPGAAVMDAAVAVDARVLTLGGDRAGIEDRVGVVEAGEHPRPRRSATSRSR